MPSSSIVMGVSEVFSVKFISEASALGAYPKSRRRGPQSYQRKGIPPPLWTESSRNVARIAPRSWIHRLLLELRLRLPKLRISDLLLTRLLRCILPFRRPGRILAAQRNTPLPRVWLQTPSSRCWLVILRGALEPSAMRSPCASGPSTQMAHASSCCCWKLPHTRSVQLLQQLLDARLLQTTAILGLLFQAADILHAERHYFYSRCQ